MFHFTLCDSNLYYMNPSEEKNVSSAFSQDIYEESFCFFTSPIRNWHRKRYLKKIFYQNVILCDIQKNCIKANMSNGEVSFSVISFKFK